MSKQRRVNRRTFCGTALGAAAAAILRPKGLSAAAPVQASGNSMAPLNQSVELGASPVGFDTAAPRLSWRLEGGGRGARQTAYQIRVAESREDLENGERGLWDSGKVESSETHLIPYDGAPLESNQRCYWKVRVWDGEDQPTEWSEAAEWITGLLDPDTEWDAEWIGLDEHPGTYPEGDDPFGTADAHWITHEDPAGGDVTTYYRRRLEVTLNEVDRVMAGLSGHHLGAFSINSQEIYSAAHSAHGGQHFGDYLDITPWLQDGENLLVMMGRSYADDYNPDQEEGGKIICSIRIDYANGETEFIRTGDGWEATREPVDFFDPAATPEDAWSAARELGAPEENDLPPLWYGVSRRPPVVYLRHEFNLSKPIRKALVHGSAFGLFDPHINGRRVTNDRFKPGWTEYRKRVSYMSYEVTGLLQEGPNAIGVELADGWYRGNLAIFGRERYGERTRFSGLLHIEYEDGSTEVIRTSPAWKARYGATLEADNLYGEIHDARLEPEGWTEPGFDDGEWRDPDTGREQEDALVRAHLCEPVTPREEITPVTIDEVAPGVYVFDMGQNFAGWARLKIHGEAGDRVVMRFSERLWPDTGRIYTENLRTLNVADTYVLKGGGEEVWEPRFTYHGYRYVQVVGLPHEPEADTLTGIAAYSAGPIRSEFECSSELITQIHQNITWGQRSNFFDIMTDCPQRDERMGWTGDYHIFSRSGSFNQECGALYRKWFHDVLDAQYERDDRADGGIPNVVPPIPDAIDAPGNMDWSYAMPVAASDLNEIYADVATLENAFPQLERYMAYVERVLENFDRDEPEAGPGMGMFGDWVTPGPDIEHPVLAWAHAADAARIMRRISETLGKGGGVEKYGDMYDRLRRQFIERWVKEDGTIANHAQTVYALAFRFGLVPEHKSGLVAQRFAERIEEDDWRPRVGFLGIRHLLPAMSIMGRPDLAYKMLQQEDYPSWSFMIENGATTIWERWNGFMPPDEFATWEMNSFNHYVFGAVDEWFFRSALGIDWAEAGFSRFRLQPEIGHGLTYAQGGCPTVRGRVSARWKIEDGEVAYEVELPANTSAELHLPVTTADALAENDVSAEEAEGVRIVGEEAGRLRIELSAGHYHFTWPEDALVEAGTSV
ncbi:MAG: family 78 glycoside hydrolase catalytic domain [Candidatus Hydrogenedentota bacterium]